MILNVNGRRRRVRARVDDTLLVVLRDQLKLLGVREACGIGMCGACTVLLDGQPVSTCLLLAGLVSATNAIVTMQGLHSPDPIQEAFIEHTAFQCSYCTPGFVLATHALLAENPTPTPEQVREYLSGNLCRCGSYLNIETAVLAAARPKS